MCGIFGIISSGISKANTDTIPILKALAHRGPDANGVAIMDGCLLAHTRLSIIDLDAGSQPMTSIDGRYTITYNGEIYNFRILKNELERLGYRFRTSSDT
jgi:asparagine synthase (glutamine-hydrolysing)